VWRRNVNKHRIGDVETSQAAAGGGSDVRRAVDHQNVRGTLVFLAS
jgi:hypothetical protein